MQLLPHKSTKKFKHLSNKYNFFQKKKNHMNLFYDQHDIPGLLFIFAKKQRPHERIEAERLV